MIVISYGLLKSGSTLAFEMTKAVLELNGNQQRRLPDGLVTEGQRVNFVRDLRDEDLERLVDATDGTTIAVKTHGTPELLSPGLVRSMLETGSLKIHVVIRDPRDIVVSMIDHSVRSRRNGSGAFSEIRSVDDAIARLAVQLDRMRRWGALSSLKLRYEEFAFDPVAGPSAISGDLGMPADPGAVWARAQASFTQRNVAQPERYRRELWPSEVERVERAFPLLLELVSVNDLGWFGSPA